ncbi:MAG TPA: PhoH family protein, partial [Firmicutes bacterium]|nr:PhoH family protein [Bacillota bacterium]
MRVSKLIRHLLPLAREGSLDSHDVRYAVHLAGRGDDRGLLDMREDTVVTTFRGKPIRPKSQGQKQYVEAIRKCGITFGIGPAGTGKTYLAVAMAVADFKEKKYNRIVLT